MNLHRMMHQFMRGDWITVRSVGIGLLVISVITALIGYVQSHPEGFSFGAFMVDFYANVSTEAMSIAITILIIDTLNRRREERLMTRREREQLIRQLGSGVNEVAKRAAEELRANGWLTDGTVQESDLRVANLEGAKLWKADLQGVNLQWARLKHANLNGSMLVGANLTQATMTAARCIGADLGQANLFEAKLYRVNFGGANLRSANLQGAHLEGAKLEGADLRGANVAEAHWDELTIMPDGAAWTSETDISRFTSANHPNAYVLAEAAAVLDNEDEGDD